MGIQHIQQHGYPAAYGYPAYPSPLRPAYPYPAYGRAAGTAAGRRVVAAGVDLFSREAAASKAAWNSALAAATSGVSLTGSGRVYSWTGATPSKTGAIGRVYSWTG